MQTLVHNRDSSWCDAGNLIIRQNCATRHYTGDRIYGRLKFFSPLLSCRLKYLPKRQQLVVSFLSQADCCQEWVGAPLYVSAYDYLLTIIFFSQPVSTFSWLSLIGEWGACKNCRALPYEAFSWKNERRFFCGKRRPSYRSGKQILHVFRRIKQKKMPLSASFHAPPDPIEPYSMHAAPNIYCYLIGQRRGPVVGLKMFWFSMNILSYMAFVRGGKKGIWLWVSSAYRYPGSHFKCALIGDCGYYLWQAIWKGLSNRPDSILTLSSNSTDLEDEIKHV